MPIGGFIVNVHPEDIKNSISALRKITGLEVYGSDDKGNVVVVIEARTSKDIEKIVDEIKNIPTVLNIGLTYLNVEDEIEGQDQKGKKGFN